MGCSSSKLENEDTVRRCRDRRRLMREAVQSRHHLASAHADYLRSLLYAASSLSRFSQGAGPLPVSLQTPPVVLLSPAEQQQQPSLSPPPPPPPPPASQSPFSPASTMPPPTPPGNPRRKHESSPPPPPTKPLRSSSTYAAATPSQASSSVWDWDNFYPPSPPDSDYFDRLNAEREQQQEQERKLQRRQYTNKHHHLEEEDEDEQEEQQREEVHCREWGEQHYSTTTTATSSTDGEDEEADKKNEEEAEEVRSFAARSDYSFSAAPPPPPPMSDFGGSASSFRKPAPTPAPRSEAGSSSAGDMRMVIRHRDLAEIAAALEEYFVKAAAAGESMSEFLETGRDQLDRSFRQLKKTVYHSNSVLSALASTWSSKPPLAIKYRLDTGVLEDSGGGKGHGSTLERLLAWEKKLYEEVKARECVKIQHEKKLSALQNLECRGKDDAKIDKTKASIQKLQSLIMVTSQAVSTTSMAITKVRDNELAPQLVDMCYGLLTMWRSINQFHEVQNHIVQQVRGLVISTAGDSTSDLHRLATRDLEAAIAGWHSSFNRLIKYQREYIRALYGWLKLTLIHVGNDDNHQKEHSSSISIKLTAFCDEWKQALDRLPDTVASEAIKSFVNIIHVISTKQEEELRIKKRAETFSRELDKKTTALRTLEKKFYQSYSTVGIAVPGSGHNGDPQVFDSRDPLAEKKLEIAACRRKVEEEMARHAKAVEVTISMTLSNIQTGLPGVFQAMAGFSGLFAEALEGLCRRAETVR
ncbi:putative MICOS complex subunit MIC60 [Iris pallida]|uniref:MICOS complex subunit MIC60 n=1 Tax=Iris pallida TaxID=29817 RepID=A0AAX6EVT6_IRIPA|nr:putative MICOS complex subunit MIC60 [Iris pallida]